VYRTVIGLRQLFGLQQFDGSSKNARARVVRKMITLASVEVISAFLGTVVTVVHLNQIFYHPNPTSMLTAWKKNLGIKFVYAVEDMYKLQKGKTLEELENKLVVDEIFAKWYEQWKVVPARAKTANLIHADVLSIPVR
jgi:hypothetical protein